jgi:hypothetical protein
MGASVELNEFLLEDYKLKVAWLQAQYDRVLQRSQLFLTLETAGAGAAILSSTGGLSPAARFVAILEALISCVWLMVGRADLRILRVYGKQLEAQGANVATAFGATDLLAVGESSSQEQQKWARPGGVYRIIEKKCINHPPIVQALVPALLIPAWIAIAAVLWYLHVHH